ncbi:MAG: hypothetical protein WBV95_02780, partial [Desulfobacterales bacterium]
AGQPQAQRSRLGVIDDRKSVDAGPGRKMTFMDEPSPNKKTIPLGRDGLAWHNPLWSCVFQELVPDGQPMVNDFSRAFFGEPVIPPGR